MTWSLPRGSGTCCRGTEESGRGDQRGSGVRAGRSPGALGAPHRLQLSLWEQREPLEGFEVKQDQPGEPSAVLAPPGTSCDFGQVSQPPGAACASRAGCDGWIRAFPRSVRNPVLLGADWVRQALPRFLLSAESAWLPGQRCISPTIPSQLSQRQTQVPRCEPASLGVMVESPATPMGAECTLSKAMTFSGCDQH